MDLAKFRQSLVDESGKLSNKNKEKFMPTNFQNKLRVQAQMNLIMVGRVQQLLYNCRRCCKSNQPKKAGNGPILE